MSAVALVFRGVTAGGFSLNVTTLTATGASTNPNPPANTPTLDNCCIVIGGSSTVQDTTPSGTITNYLPATPVNNNATDTNPSTTAMAYRILSGGAGVSTDPGAFTSWSNSSWVAFTAVLRPSGVAFDATATFAGAGRLTALALVNVDRLAGWPTVGQWALGQYSRAPVAASVTHQVTATFVGAGNFSGNILKSKDVTATFVGAGALTATARLNEIISANFAGAGVLSANTQKFKDLAASFNGAGGRRTRCARPWSRRRRSRVPEP